MSSYHIFFTLWLPVFHYLREAVRWCWKVPGFPVPKPVTYVLTNLVSAVIAGILSPMMYTDFVDSMQSMNIKRTIAAGCVMLVFLAWEWRAWMIYSGRWDVQRRMQMSLIRKYLSLDMLDMEEVCPLMRPSVPPDPQHHTTRSQAATGPRITSFSIEPSSSGPP
jgi:hypothetical protein